MTMCNLRVMLKSFKFALLSLMLSLSFAGAARAESDPHKIEGVDQCKECHEKEVGAWRGTHHFTTFKAMQKTDEAKQIKKKMGVRRLKGPKSPCVQCHYTLQFQTKRKKVRAISGISCESCHGPAKEWKKPHSEYSGKKKGQETPDEIANRWKTAESKGMIRPKALYLLAKNCLSCHVVPHEKLVNVGGHPAGSPFELVAWSQGEVRHNFQQSEGKRNVPASKERRRMMFVVGLAVELEAALRGVAVATENKKYAASMAVRADAALKKLGGVANALPEIPELAAIVKAGDSAGLKVNNKGPLTAAADKIMELAMGIVANYDGGKLAAVDGMLPDPKTYKGKAAK